MPACRRRLHRAAASISRGLTMTSS
jgi:hypothetical protein